MPAQKLIDERSFTRGGGVIRVEAWCHLQSGAVDRYNLAYVNEWIHPGDNGRVVGFDNSHRYPGFSSRHHAHWFGQVFENRTFVSFEQTLTRFQRLLGRLRQQYGKVY